MLKSRAYRRSHSRTFCNDGSRRVWIAVDDRPSHASSESRCSVRRHWLALLEPEVPLLRFIVAVLERDRRSESASEQILWVKLGDWLVPPGEFLQQESGRTPARSPLVVVTFRHHQILQREALKILWRGVKFFGYPDFLCDEPLSALTVHRHRAFITES
jgi:hypothetical protein